MDIEQAEHPASPDGGDAHTDRRTNWMHRSLGVLAILAVAAGGGWSSYGMLRSFGGHVESRFGVVMFSLRPAVMFAAGKGMRDIDGTEAAFPSLFAFNNHRVPTFNVADIPKEYTGMPVTSSYPLMHYYLMCAMGWTWRMLGVSEWALNVLAAVLYTLLVLVLYGLFRIGMGRLLSLGLVLWLSFSPTLLYICPSIRDFAKAPFLLGALLILAHLVNRNRSVRSLIACSGALGIIVGIGFGFRQDVALAVPLAVMGLLFFVPLSTARVWHARLAAVLVFLVAFVVVGWTPIRGTMADQGSASAQAFVQGVSRDAECRMDFGGASYTHHYDYGDYLDFSVVNTYARRTGDTTPMPGHFTAGHGQAGQRLVREYWRTFPGDMVARAVSAIWVLPRIPSMVKPCVELSRDANVGVLKARLRWYEVFLRSANMWGWPVLIVALTLLYASRPRLGLFLGGSLLFLAAYPSLLFEYRHFFHLSFIPYWAAGVAVSQSIGLGRRMGQETGFAVTVLKRVGTFFGIACAVTGAVVCVQSGARLWQDRDMEKLRERYAKARLEACPFTSTEQQGNVYLQLNTVLPNLAKGESLPPFEAAGEYVALAFENVQGDLPVGFKYDESPTGNFSQNVAIPRPLFGVSGKGRFFFPVYELVWPGMPRGHFKGIVLSREAFACLRGLWRVQDSETFRLWPFVVIPEERSSFRGHKTGPFDRVLAQVCGVFGNGTSPEMTK